jgi:hypothetical protein
VEKYDSFIRKKGYRAGRYCISLEKCWHPCSLDLTKFLFILSPLILISLSVAPFAHNHKPTRHKKKCHPVPKQASFLAILPFGQGSRIYDSSLKLFFLHFQEYQRCFDRTSKVWRALTLKVFRSLLFSKLTSVICKNKMKKKKRIKNRIIEFWFLPKGRGEQIKIDWLTGKKRNSTAWTEWDRSIARGRDG